MTYKLTGKKYKEIVEQTEEKSKKRRVRKNIKPKRKKKSVKPKSKKKKTKRKRKLVEVIRIDNSSKRGRRR